MGDADGRGGVDDRSPGEPLEAGDLNRDEIAAGRLPLEPQDEIHRLLAGVRRDDEAGRSRATLEGDRATSGARDA